MTHDELLTEIDIQLRHLPSYFHEGDKTIAGMKALRAVVELHKPHTNPPNCRECDEPYPCPTIQAIQEQLK